MSQKKKSCLVKQKKEEKQNNYHTHSSRNQKKKRKKKAMSKKGGKNERKRQHAHCSGKQKIKENKRKEKDNCPYASAHGYFCLLSNLIFSFQISLHFGEKTFMSAQGENTRTPPFIFLLFHPTKYTLKKVFLPIFSPKFSIHSISHPNKHTLKDLNHRWIKCISL